MATSQTFYNNISAGDLRFLLKNVDVFNKEVADFTPWLTENQHKLFGDDLSNLCWAPLYELSFGECLARFFVYSGLTSELSEIAMAENKVQATYQFQQNIDHHLDRISADLSEEQRPSYILNVLAYGVIMMKNARSLMAYGLYINDLVAIARTANDIKISDDALFKAIRMDASVVGCQTALGRISKAVLLNDTKFFKKLNNAITGKLGVREEKNFQKIRFILQVLHESGGIGLNDKGLKDLFVKELNLYSDPKSSSEKNLKEFTYNFKHQKSTI